MVEVEWSSSRYRMAELNFKADVEWPMPNVREAEWRRPNDQDVKIEKSTKKSRPKG